MSFEFLQKLPTPAEIREQYPMPEKLALLKEKRDEEIKKVITGESDKFLVIIGPCSADNEDSVCDYVNRLAAINDKVSDKCILIPRIYWLTDVHDLLSYVAIGARSVEDQQHRLTVSGFDVPAGMKNPTSGDLSVMMNSVYAAQHPHEFIYRNWEVKTTGNPLAHTILRGSVNQYGRNLPNYHYEDLNRLMEMYNERDLMFPATVIDANHNNSGKKYEQQVRIVKEVLHSRKSSKVNSPIPLHFGLAF